MPERIRLDGMAYGGAAVGRLANGLTMFVQGGLAGELVEIDVLERKRSFGRGRVRRVLEPSPNRVPPPCPHFKQGCGGCQWQHASHSAQLEYKAQILAEQLRRMGGVAEPPLLPAAPAALQFGYRNTAQFHVSESAIGFNREGSHQLIDIADCPLVEAPINLALAAVRERWAELEGIVAIHIRAGSDALQIALLTTENPRGYKLLAAALAERIEGGCRVAGVGFGKDRVRGLHGEPWVWMSCAGRKFRVSPPSFFQVHSAVADDLASDVLAQVRPDDRVLDLFSGVGTFGLLAADRARQVVGVEESATAIADANANAAEAGAADNVRFVHSDVAAIGELVASGWELTVLDPPRAGCPRPLLEALDSQRIAYVSCDPSTLARDVKILAGRGYSLESVRMYDMFPQTYHIEALAVLSR